MKKTLTLLLPLAALLMSGCSDRPPSAVAPSPVSFGSPSTSPSPPSGASADKWIGQWTGPEGTYLHLSKTGDAYTVKIQSLDNLNAYEGQALGDGIQFQRAGKTETIRAGSGEGTGMKWLKEKKDCLVINTGEGFCRD